MKAYLKKKKKKISMVLGNKRNNHGVMLNSTRSTNISKYDTNLALKLFTYPFGLYRVFTTINFLELERLVSFHMLFFPIE